MMNFYPKSGHSSAINGYEIVEDKIYVRFKGGKVYGYSYESAGVDNIEEMKILARKGEGLLRFINANVNKKFFFSGTEDDYHTAYTREHINRGIAPMPKKLKTFNFGSYVSDEKRLGSYGVHVFYSETVAECDKVPGLLECVATEYGIIMDHMMNFFGTEFLPWEIEIELSDLHMVAKYGSMSDTEIVDAINRLYKQCEFLSREDVIRILGEHKYENKLFGTYSSSDRVVRLYYRMFDAKCGQDYYLAQVINTLAHELLHANHHIFAPETFDDDSMEAVRVKEALADFYAFLYSLNCGCCRWEKVYRKSIKVVSERYDAWIEKFDSWPYSNALKFLPKTDCGFMAFTEELHRYDICHGKYDKVWCVSRFNMKEAYEILDKMYV